MNPTHRGAPTGRFSAARSVFTRILVGVDGTEPGFEACRQAARLAEEGASVEAVSVVHLVDPIWKGLDAPLVSDELRQEADVALDKAIAILGDTARRRSVSGSIVAAVLREIELTRATTLAIGSHGHRRATEIVFGGVAGELLHLAPCTVLVARPPGDPAFPSSIIVGVDGSTESDAALAVATRLAERFAIPLRVVVALRGKGVYPEHIRLLAPQAELVDKNPVEALVAAAGTDDLLVVGSRGLHALRALGSVSERVAHKATSSVLVVRVEQSV